jgi:broad specificity phosphatase PhoE
MRHGEVDYFGNSQPRVHPDAVVLTPTGRLQAAAAGRCLGAVQFDRVITSGLRRTTETARLVMDEAEQIVDFEVWPELAELRSGRPDAIPQQLLDQAFLEPFRGRADADASFIGGERIGSLLVSVRQSLGRLLSDQGWKTVLLVLHGAVNRAILSWALSGEWVFLGHIEQSYGCINIVDIDADVRAHPVVRAVNVTPEDLAQSADRRTSIEQTLDAYRTHRRRMQKADSRASS